MSGSLTTSVRPPTDHRASTSTGSSVVHAAAVSSGIARNPNTTKKPVRARPTNVIWMAWEKIVTRPMFTRWRIVGRSATGPAAAGAVPSTSIAGVPAASSSTCVHESKRLRARISAGIRERVNTAPRRKKMPSVAT